jgi:hypothetical protein
MHGHQTYEKSKRRVLRKDYLRFSGVLDSTRVVLPQSCAKIRSCTRETLTKLKNIKEGGKDEKLIQKDPNLTKEGGEKLTKTSRNEGQSQTTHKKQKLNT